MSSDSNSAGAFYPIWKKYKPVILQLMKKTLDTGPQQYPLSKHEFNDVKPVQNMVLPFQVLVKSGGRLKSEKKSIPAEELVKVLKSSDTAMSLLESVDFTFQLDRDFNFHISSESEPPVEE